jgi:hypothetical protein
MNLISLIRTENLSDLTIALRELANEIDKVIKLRGDKANCMGGFPLGEKEYADYDYQIQNRDYLSLDHWIECINKRK